MDIQDGQDKRTRKMKPFRKSETPDHSQDMRTEKNSDVQALRSLETHIKTARVLTTIHEVLQNDPATKRKFQPV